MAGEVILKTKSPTICGSDICAIYREQLGKGAEAYRLMASGACGKVSVAFDEELV